MNCIFPDCSGRAEETHADGIVSAECLECGATWQSAGGLVRFEA